MYCRVANVFGNDKRDHLLEKNINRHFIKKDDQKKYYEYLENNLQGIVSDTMLSHDGKTEILYSTSINLAKDLFNDPTVGNIKRTKTFACNMVDYILKEGSAARSLLKIAVQEYDTNTRSVNVAAVGSLFANDLGYGVEDIAMAISSSVSSGIWTILIDLSLVIQNVLFGKIQKCLNVGSLLVQSSIMVSLN